jgi:hypothetical protein
MFKAVVVAPGIRQVTPVMLTGDQIAAARKLCGFTTQADLGRAAKVSTPTIARAELARGEIPGMGTDAMVKIVKSLENAGIEFYLDHGATAAGGLGMRVKPTVASEPQRARHGRGNEEGETVQEVVQKGAPPL